MRRIIHIAVREFKATALTKGFIFGGIVLPLVLLGVMAIALPLLMNDKTPPVVGSVGVIDRTGVLEGPIRERFSPESVEGWQKRRMGEVVERAEKAAEGAGDAQGARDAAGVIQSAQAIRAEMSVEMLAPLDDEKELAIAKEPLTRGENLQDGGRMALVVIDDDAVAGRPGQDGFGGFQVFTRPKLDDRVVDLVRDQVRDAIRQTRIRSAGLDPARLDALTTVSQRQTQEVTQTGERRAMGQWNIMLQFAFMLLMMMSVFISGQYLLTTTIEEKSSRVIELLLASASPMSLMTGKIFGQMGVGLFLVLVYGSLGLSGLVLASMADLVSPLMIVWFFCFYFIAYTTIASLMAAIGSAVNDLREAQSLMSPVMMIVMLPYMLWLPISRDPNSMFATITSFVPGVNPFVMMLRLTSTEQPPLWQVLVSIVIGVVTAWGAVWVAAKVFRIGLLMFGKPPNYATLMRWIRMA